MMRMMSISLIVVSSWLSLFAQPDGVQLDIQKHFGVPQPKRLFSIHRRIRYGPEVGLVLSKLFLINQDGYYFYFSFFGVYPYYRISCYDRNGRLVSNFEVLSEKERFGDDREASVQCVSLFDDGKICFLVHQFRRIIKEKTTEEYSYKFLVFTPHGKIDEKSTNKLNQMIEKLNNDMKNNQLIRLYFDEMIIDNKNDIIDLFYIIVGEIKNIRIFHDGKYSLREISFKTDRLPSIDPKGNLIVCNYNEKTKEIIIKIFRRDGEYKDIDEVKIKIEKNMIHYSDIETDAKRIPTAFTVDPRGHIFIVFPIKESLFKTEWQIEKYDYGIEKADSVMKYPGYVVYEFASTGQLIGPRALLQTLYVLLSDKDADWDLKNGHRLKLDDQGNLYYLHYQSDSTQIWMVPSSRNAK